jgi:hypothetical protein
MQKDKQVSIIYDMLMRQYHFLKKMKRLHSIMAAIKAKRTINIEI